MMAVGGHKLIAPTAEAMAFTWEGAAWPSRRDGVAPVRRRVEALSAVGVDVVVLSQADVAHVDEQLRSRPPGPGRLLLCGGRGTDLFEAGPEGLRPLRVRADGRSGGLLPRAAGRTCGPDAIQGVLGLLAGRGVGPGLILLIGTEFGVLDGVAGSDSWLLGTETARVIGVFLGGGPGGVPAVLAAVVYDGTGPGQHLLPGPGWTAVPIEPAPAQDVRVLDLRTGVLARTEQGLDAYPLRSLRFASITLPGVVAMRAEALADRLRPGVPFQRPPGKAMPGGHQDGVHGGGGAGRQAGRCPRGGGAGAPGRGHRGGGGAAAGGGGRSAPGGGGGDLRH